MGNDILLPWYLTNHNMNSRHSNNIDWPNIYKQSTKSNFISYPHQILLLNNIKCAICYTEETFSKNNVPMQKTLLFRNWMDYILIKESLINTTTFEMHYLFSPEAMFNLAFFSIELHEKYYKKIEQKLKYEDKFLL